MAGVLATTPCLGGPSVLRAQVMEPLSYTNAPVGLNFFIAGYGYLWGDVLADPSLPFKDVDAEVHTAVLTYARVLDFWGQSGSVALVVPYAWLSASGEVAGQSRSVDRSALGDITLRASVNLYAAPALSLEECQAYRQDTIVGLSLWVTAPTGKYDPGRLINIGTNRWAFKPEVGISKALGRWALEARRVSPSLPTTISTWAPTSDGRSRCTACKVTPGTSRYSRSTTTRPSASWRCAISVKTTIIETAAARAAREFCGDGLCKVLHPRAK